MKEPDLDKLIQVRYGPYDEGGARRAIEAFVDMFLAVEAKRARQAEARRREAPGKKPEETLDRGR